VADPRWLKRKLIFASLKKNNGGAHGMRAAVVYGPVFNADGLFCAPA
jgi:hypothetical protein